MPPRPSKKVSKAKAKMAKPPLNPETATPSADTGHETPQAMATSRGGRKRVPTAKRDQEIHEIAAAKRTRDKKKAQAEVVVKKRAARTKRAEAVNADVSHDHPTTTTANVEDELDAGALRQLLAEERAKTAADQVEFARLRKENEDLHATVNSQDSTHDAVSSTVVGIWYTNIPDGSIEQPPKIGSLQSRMGLSKHKALYDACRRAVKQCANMRGFDFGKSWSKQPDTMCYEIISAAAEVQPYLKKFSLKWPADEILQSYLNSVRTYQSCRGDSQSYVYRNRVKNTDIGEREHEEAEDMGLFDNGNRYIGGARKRKSNNPHYNRGNDFVTCKDPITPDVDDEELSAESESQTHATDESQQQCKKQKKSKGDKNVQNGKATTGKKKAKVNDTGKKALSLSTSRSSKESSKTKESKERTRMTKKVPSVLYGSIKQKDQGVRIAMPSNKKPGGEEHLEELVHDGKSSDEAEGGDSESSESSEDEENGLDLSDHSSDNE